MAHPVDIHVGQRVRQRRWILGMTQAQLGERVGIKLAQMQKYETGANRISASRMWDIAAALDVPVSFFFEGLEGPARDESLAHGSPRISPDEGLERALAQAVGFASHENQEALVTRVAQNLPDIAGLRQKLGITQKEFARLTSIPVRTLRNWEQGRRMPSGAARVLLIVIEKCASSFHPERTKQLLFDVNANVEEGGAERVRHIREKSGLTQSQFAACVGIPLKSLQNWEQERRAPEASAKVLLEIFDVIPVIVTSALFEIGREILDDLKRKSRETSKRDDVLTDKEALELVRSYYAIPETQRKRLFNLRGAITGALDEAV